MERVDLAILLVDISGSTALYRRRGDVEARRRVLAELDRLSARLSAAGGSVVARKGDDVLGVAATPAQALAAAQAMLEEGPDPELDIHGGLHFGPVLRTAADIHGDAVNLTARLAARAKPGEFCVSADFAGRLDAERAAALRPLGRLAFKGIVAPLAAFSLTDESSGARTVRLDPHDPSPAAAREVTALVLRHRGGSVRMREKLTLGRSADCDLVLDRPWVSRVHARLRMGLGQVLLQDLSSVGTWLAGTGGRELVLRRETVPLPESGAISLGLATRDPRAETIEFEVVRS